MFYRTVHFLIQFVRVETILPKQKRNYVILIFNWMNFFLFSDTIERCWSLEKRHQFICSSISSQPSESEKFCFLAKLNSWHFQNFDTQSLLFLFISICRQKITSLYIAVKKAQWKQLLNFRHLINECSKQEKLLNKNLLILAIILAT